MLIVAEVSVPWHLLVSLQATASEGIWVPRSQKKSFWMSCVSEHQFDFTMCSLEQIPYLSNFSVPILVATPTVAALVGQKEKNPTKQSIFDNIFKYKPPIYHKSILLVYNSVTSIVSSGKV